MLALPLVFVAARATNLFDAKALALRTSLGRRLAETSTRLDRQSFGWRLRVEERAARVALQRPLLGWSRWDWWRGSSTGERPWGLFSLVLGMYGVVGLSLLFGSLALPIAAFLNLGPPRFWINPSRASAAAMAGSLALNGLDAILNSNFLLLYLAAAGGLVGLRGHAAAASAWMKRAPGWPPMMGRVEGEIDRCTTRSPPWVLPGLDPDRRWPWSGSSGPRRAVPIALFGGYLPSALGRVERAPAARGRHRDREADTSRASPCSWRPSSSSTAGPC